MKKITLIYDFLKELGGLERVMVHQANSLRKKYFPDLLFGYILKSKKKEILRELGLKEGIPVYQLGNSKSEILQLIKFFLFPPRIKRSETDLVISHSFMGTRMAEKLKESKGIPYVVMMHHPPNFVYDRDIKWANNIPRFFGYLLGLFLGSSIKAKDKKAVRNADAVIVNSNYTKKRIKEIYGIDAKVIYPSLGKEFKIKNKKHCEKRLSKFNIKNKFVLLHGRIIKDKRPDLAIRAFSKIDNCNLVISGAIEEKRKIISLINELGIKNRVKFLGKVTQEELVSLYNLASCFLMTAPKEDFGLTPIEAMACGCPVVAWNDGAGPNETVLKGTNGFLARPYDVNDFSKKVSLCLKRNWDKNKISSSVRKFSNKDIEKKFNYMIGGLL